MDIGRTLSGKGADKNVYLDQLHTNGFRLESGNTTLQMNPLQLRHRSEGYAHIGVDYSDCFRIVAAPFAYEAEAVNDEHDFYLFRLHLAVAREVRTDEEVLLVTHNELPAGFKDPFLMAVSLRNFCKQFDVRLPIVVRSREVDSFEISGAKNPHVDRYLADFVAGVTERDGAGLLRMVYTNLVSDGNQPSSAGFNSEYGILDDFIAAAAEYSLFVKNPSFETNLETILNLGVRLPSTGKQIYPGREYLKARGVLLYFGLPQTAESRSSDMFAPVRDTLIWAKVAAMSALRQGSLERGAFKAKQVAYNWMSGWKIR